MAHSLVGMGGTGVVFVALMPMHPAVVAGERGLRGPYPSCRSCWSHRRSPPPFCSGRRICLLFVVCCEHCDCGREGQVGRRELLEDGCVVCCHKS